MLSRCDEPEQANCIQLYVREICEGAESPRSVVEAMGAARGSERGSVSKREHEPLLELDGKPIGGLKRCKNCGLCETYWQRFPVCESKSMAMRIAKQVRP